MYELTIPALEIFDGVNNKFVTVKKEQHYKLEHSLISLSKWEEKWKVPYLDENRKKTDEELFDYICCMSLSELLMEDCKRIPESTLREIQIYINDQKTATTIRSRAGSIGHQIITSELLYCWMFMAHIPKECERWHLSRLIMLIRVYSEENRPKGKVSQEEQAARYADINARNREKFKSKG